LVFMTRFYFDHNATTPLDDRVARLLVDTIQATFGNASSIHREGQQARQILEASRRRIAARIGANAAEIVFTSGGTESDNLAIAGIMASAPGPAHLITTCIEHPAVLEPCRELERRGMSVTYLPVDRTGVVDPTELERQIRPETRLVSIMHANNEIGTVQPLREIAAIIRKIRDGGQAIYLHSDGVQTSGRISVNVSDLRVDLYSLSAHKVNGPKGVGALFVRKGVPLRSIQFGGRHERERRPGTENVAGAAAFAEALDLALSDNLASTIRGLRDQFEHKICTALDDIDVNGATVERLPNTSSVHFAGLAGEALVIALDLKGFAVSTGSACSSGSIEPSHVLLAMGHSKEDARRSVRFSFGRGNTAESTDALASAVIECVRQLRQTHSRKEARHAYVPA
jgi:cysteine desulfurase